MDGHPDDTPKCSNCGRPSSGSDRFCTGCGARLPPHAPAPATQQIPAAAPLAPTPRRSDRGGVPVVPTAVGAITIVLIGVALYVGGVFGASGKSRSAASTTAVAPPATAPATTPTSTAPPSTSTAPQGNPGPAATLRTYFHELGSGQARAAFAFMSAAYKAKNPSWISEREAAHPQINLISVGTASYFSGGATVPVEFYARDKFPSHGSDTQCRGFSGTIAMIHLGGEWRYEPGASHLTATVVESSSADCP